jgi:hypothetical protein
MAVPNSRETFKEKVLRSLGKGVVRINVSDDQVEDAIDIALAKGRDYHFDFAQETFYKQLITDEIKTQGYIELPDNVISAYDIFPLTNMMMGGGIFNAQYQFVFQNIWEWQAQSMIPYFIGFQQMQFIEGLLVGQQPIKYNRYMNQLRIDMDWDRILTGQYIIVKVYASLDPNTYTKIWADQWLHEYVAAMIKKQWGQNMSKFQQFPGPGGIMYNGQKLKEEAMEELHDLDEKLIKSFSMPIDFLIGAIATLAINTPWLASSISGLIENISAFT